jgi:hypothetical protein
MNPWTDCGQGVLIPSVKEVENIEPFDVRWILVIEKEVPLEALYFDISDTS